MKKRLLSVALQGANIKVSVHLESGPNSPLRGVTYE